MQLDFLNKVLVPWRDNKFGPKSPVLLFADACGKLRGCASFVNRYKEENIQLVIGPANLTAKWQPFDAGIGKTLKDRMRIDGLSEWLKTKKHRRLWSSEEAEGLRSTRPTHTDFEVAWQSNDENP